MQFRVYDTQLDAWCDEEFCLSSCGDIFMINHTMFGKDKIELVSDERYIVHNYINAHDTYGNPIFEGDICMHTEDDEICGVVAYSDEHASYYVFDEKHEAYYRLISENREEMKVVGNVFDGIIMQENDISNEEGDNNDSNQKQCV